jgi:hypothetical protein
MSHFGALGKFVGSEIKEFSFGKKMPSVPPTKVTANNLPIKKKEVSKSVMPLKLVAAPKKEET